MPEPEIRVWRRVPGVSPSETLCFLQVELHPTILRQLPHDAAYGVAGRKCAPFLQGFQKAISKHCGGVAGTHGSKSGFAADKRIALHHPQIKLSELRLTELGREIRTAGVSYVTDSTMARPSELFL